jgi:hypothetical protein
MDGDEPVGGAKGGGKSREGAFERCSLRGMRRGELDAEREGWGMRLAEPVVRSVRLVGFLEN